MTSILTHIIDADQAENLSNMQELGFLSIKAQDYHKDMNSQTSSEPMTNHPSEVVINFKILPNGERQLFVNQTPQPLFFSADMQYYKILFGDYDQDSDNDLILIPSDGAHALQSALVLINTTPHPTGGCTGW